MSLAFRLPLHARLIGRGRGISSDVFLAAEGDGAPPEPGKRISVVARGFLPYRLRFTMECLEVERPARILSRLTGDFEARASGGCARTGT